MAFVPPVGGVRALSVVSRGDFVRRCDDVRPRAAVTAAPARNGAASMKVFGLFGSGDKQPETKEGLDVASDEWHKYSELAHLEGEEGGPPAPVNGEKGAPQQIANLQPGSDITGAELLAAREAWGAGLIAVSTAYDAGGINAAKQVANNVLDAAYGYNMGPVMFKPTLASGEQTFRPTKKGALSYFVADDPDYPNDGGFALKGWRSFASVTSASFMQGDVAMWMGWVILTDAKGETTTVDKSFGYKKDADGTLRIVLHHSSLPYSPGAGGITEEEMLAARKAWGGGLVAISMAYDDEGIDAAKKVANDVLDNVYGYNMGPVMFKPTLASGGQTFRPTRKGALSYFVGDDADYPNDGGFALKSWRGFDSVTSATFMQGDVAMWMGWVIVINDQGEMTTVDKSFGYKRDATGKVRIVLHHSSLPYSPPGAGISEEEMLAARTAWGDGLIAISKAYDDKGIDSAKKVANDVLDDVYGYEMGPVMFKPTLASGGQTFRPTRKGALSYFVSDDPDYPSDGGFALKSWRGFDSVTSATFTQGDVAMWMGKVIVSNDQGEMTTVDKSFGYKRDASGKVRIVLHHSSLPFTPPPTGITEDELLAARTAWGDGLVAISKAYDDNGIDAAKKLANDVLDSAYGYNMGPVMFKPTLASGEQTFRPDRTGALSYFVADNPDYANDSGFALKSWRSHKSETSATFTEGDVAMWMGNISITDDKGATTTVDKSFGYKKDANGVLRIVLHHSSLPYQP